MKKYIIIAAVGLFVGCASNKQEELYDLLHRDELLAYKSITIKDYKGKKDFN